jgi:hypothetical protein
MYFFANVDSGHVGFLITAFIVAERCNCSSASHSHPSWLVSKLPNHFTGSHCSDVLRVKRQRPRNMLQLGAQRY